MQDFIQMAAQQLNIGEDSATSATAGVLGLLKEHGSAEDFSGLLSKVPGAESLLSDGGGGGMGGGMLGGDRGGSPSSGRRGRGQRRCQPRRTRPNEWRAR